MVTVRTHQDLKSTAKRSPVRRRLMAVIVLAGLAQLLSASSALGARMVLLLNSKDATGWRSVKQEVTHLNGRVLSVFPPDVMVVDIDPAIAAEWVKSGLIRGASQDAVAESAGSSLSAAAGLAYWNHSLNARRAPRVGPPVPEDAEAPEELSVGPVLQTKENDVFLPPDIPPALLKKYESVGFRTREDEAAAKALATDASKRVSSVGDPANYTSAYMSGEIVVGVLMPESNGTSNPNIEDWTAAEMNQDRTWITTGLDRFQTDCPTANITWIYHFEEAPAPGGLPGTIDCDYEAITNCYSALTNALSRLYYPGSPDPRAYDNYLRNLYGADWAYFIFVVDNTVTMTGRAWAYLGGPYTQCYSRSCGDLLIQHESGHIFWGMDEYHPDAARSPSSRWGYLEIVNANSQYNDGTGFNGGAGEGLQALMLNNYPQHSAFSTGQVGWYDSDGDGILDVSQSYPTVTLQLDGVAGGVATFSGQANVTPVRSQNLGFGVGLSVNEIAKVEWRIVGQAWQPATPADGTFDTGVESFSFATPALPNGTYTIEGRATNNLGIITLLPTKTTLTVTGSAVTDAAPFASLKTPMPVQQRWYYVQLDASGSTDLETPTGALQARWDWTSDGTWDTGFSTVLQQEMFYNDPGNVTATVQVKDAAGHMSTASATVLITELNADPVARLKVSTGYVQGTFNPTFTFDASGSYDPEGGELSFYWDWDGDGWMDESGTNPIVSHTYTLPTTGGGKSDTWTMKLRIADLDRGNTDITREIWACPYNHYPELNANVYPQIASTDTIVIFDMSGSTDPDKNTTWDGILEYRLDFDGDGNWDTDTLPGPYLFHNFPQTGTYNVRVQVRDRFNATDEDTVTIQVGTDPVQQPFFVTGGSMESAYMQILPGAQHQFVLNMQYIGTPGDLSARWFVDNVEGGNETVGSITSGGLYTAPETLNYHVIKAISNQNPSVIMYGGVSVNMNFLEVFPGEGTVIEGQTLQFTVNCGFINDPTVSWTVNDIPGGHPAIGTVDSGNLFHAPATVYGMRRIKCQCRSNEDPTVFYNVFIYIKSADLPTADFSASVVEGDAPLSVDFTAITTGTVTSWQWSFDEGGTAATPAATHVFADPGLYTVSLKVAGPGGTAEKTVPAYIRANGGTAPLVDFHAWWNPATYWNYAEFIPTTIGDITDYSWDFAGLATDTVRQGHWDYPPLPGPHTISLTVTGPGGSATKTKPNYLKVAGSYFTLDFLVYGATTGPAPFSVEFVALPDPSGCTYTWDFGDGTIELLGPNPTHVYQEPGVYTVKLTVPMDEEGIGDICQNPDNPEIAFEIKPDLIHVQSPPASCTGNSECDDGVYCNGAETCVDGHCQPGTNPCPGRLCRESDDTCVDCLSAADCQDGTYCNGAEICVNGACQPGTNPCPGQLCRESDDTCVDCLSAADCQDGTYCNGAEVCVNGTCQPGTDPCPGQLCRESDDTCVDCLSAADCDDGAYCNGVETCDANGNCQPGSDPCPGALCRESDNMCVECLTAADCQDGIYCNGAELCDADGNCQPGGDPCPDQLCRESDDRCVDCLSATDCQDGQFCNGAEVCDGNGNCQAGANPCPGQLCRESDDRCVECLTAADCSDGLFCNGAEVCDGNGNCQAGANPCPGQLCRESDDRCVECLTAADCSDGLFCNGAETCDGNGNCQAGTNPCPGQNCDEGNDICVPYTQLWMSFNTATAVPGVGTVQDEDIVAYNLGTQTWSLVFDGSDVGLSSYAISGMAVLPSGDILLSFATSATIPGLIGGPSGTSVTAYDIVRFVPTSLGATTAGTFYFYFDGSDVGLTKSGEEIDAITLAPDGRLVISMGGSFSVNGVSGEDEDLVIFTATSLGSVTAGTFAMYFDGSDVGLSQTADEDVDAACLTSAGTLLFSTVGNFSVTGLTGADEDVAQFSPTSWGTNTAGTYSMYLDLSTLGISTAADVSSLELVE